mmetsp:Transcript_23347/g.74446  ORF Transcript_23347/g.74446 Transcript_23347/m.74446 type:complete len:245 (-) Transcript_23347:842-1576(-)
MELQPLLVHARGFLIHEAESLQQAGVAVMEHLVERVHVIRGEVGQVDLSEPGLELARLTKLHSEGIGLEFEFARQGVEHKSNRGRKRGDNIREEVEPDNHGHLGVVEPKREVHVGVVQKVSKSLEDRGVQDVLDDKAFNGVRQFPVAQLVAKDADDLLCGALQAGLLRVANQRVEQNDALILPETEKVGVGVARTLRAVHFIELGERKLQRRGQLLNLRLELALRQRVVRVEEWGDEVGIDSEH